MGPHVGERRRKREGEKQRKQGSGRRLWTLVPAMRDHAGEPGDRKNGTLTARGSPRWRRHGRSGTRVAAAVTARERGHASSSMTLQGERHTHRHGSGTGKPSGGLGWLEGGRGGRRWGQHRNMRSRAKLGSGLTGERDRATKVRRPE